ncbi:MAG: glycine cleavage T C-terminal barrel domain-containing protein, partial [Pseudomonadota bacterium]
RVINGPFTFASDGNPLVGPVPGLRNYWSACAVMAGFSQGGGVGLILAEWMIEGEPSRDVFAMDVARFGDWITPGYTRAKVRENYQRRFSVAYPNEELPAARPFNTTPAYGMWKSRRAVFGAAYGMEAVNYFAPDGEPLEETPSFRRSNAFDAVGAECRAVRSAVGLNEIHNFSKFLVEGPGARDWLDRIMAGRIPKAGRLSLTPMLSPRGKLIGDFTVTCLAEGRFQITGSFGAQAYHQRWFEQHLPDAGVTLRNISTRRIGYQIAGPKARDLLARVTDADVSNVAFPFMTVRQLDIGPCAATVQRVSYTGDLGYEIYVSAEEQVALYHILTGAGADLGITPFGMRAMMSLRLEKSFGSWLREFKPDYMPVETGLDRFVSYNKPVDFIGKAAAMKEKAEGPARRLCTFVVDATDADVWADEPIYIDGEVVGFVTSGGYAHYSEKSVALGFLPVDHIAKGLEVEIEILGELRKAKLITEVLFDPKAERMRG